MRAETACDGVAECTATEATLTVWISAGTAYAAVGQASAPGTVAVTTVTQASAARTVAPAVAAILAKELAEQTTVRAASYAGTRVRAARIADLIATTGITTCWFTADFTAATGIATSRFAADITATAGIATVFAQERCGHDSVRLVALNSGPRSTLSRQDTGPSTLWAQHTIGGAAGCRQTEHGNDAQETFHQNSPLKRGRSSVLECRREPNLSHRSGWRTVGAP